GATMAASSVARGCPASAKDAVTNSNTARAQPDSLPMILFILRRGCGDKMETLQIGVMPRDVTLRQRVDPACLAQGTAEVRRESQITDGPPTRPLGGKYEQVARASTASRTQSSRAAPRSESDRRGRWANSRRLARRDPG